MPDFSTQLTGLLNLEASHSAKSVPARFRFRSKQGLPSIETVCFRPHLQKPPKSTNPKTNPTQPKTHPLRPCIICIAPNRALLPVTLVVPGRRTVSWSRPPRPRSHTRPATARRWHRPWSGPGGRPRVHATGVRFEEPNSNAWLKRAQEERTL